MDYVTKAYAYNGTVRLFVSTSTKLVNEAIKKHHLWPTAAQALGRTLTMGAMMGLSYKEPVDLTIRINGNGPLGEIVVLANEQGHVRGYVSNPEVFMEYKSENNKGKLNVGMAVGIDGELTVTKDLKLRMPFTSSCALQTGEIAEDFTYYYASSEQIPSSVSLGVLIDTNNLAISAGGFLLQLMPGHKKDVIDKIENILKDIKPISEMINTMTHEEIINILTSGDYQILEKKEIKYDCPCSKEKFSKGIQSLNDETIDELIHDEKAEIVCNFCQKKYLFNKEDLIKIKETKIKRF